MTTPALHYEVRQDARTHLFELTLTIARPAKLQRVSLPVWIPGSYLVREFARHVQGLTAQQGKHTLPVMQIDKCTWDIACKPRQTLVLRYQVYAQDNSVRAAWLDAQRGFFNGTGLLLRVHGQEKTTHQLTLHTDGVNPAWQVATGLKPVKIDARGFGTYSASHYDELVDCPVEMGQFWRGRFTACGVPHEFVVAGATAAFDGERLLKDTQAICEAEITFWHGKAKPPFDNYVFMLNATHDAYGGLEHRNSTALICSRKDLPQKGQVKTSEGYTTLLGLISHEYFHTWNVKRLRPAEFKTYDYTQENYTQLLWFFEGFTSYYDDLLLRRAGLLDDAGYVKLLNKTINQVLQTPGRQVQSVAQASFDAWVKYYRQDENTPNATVSYYTKGALVALCLDLSLRNTGHKLDEVMRGLYKRCKAGPMAQADLEAVLLRLTGREWSKELAAWVHSTQELPLQDLLTQHGLQVHQDPAQWAQRLGLRVSEANGITIKVVLRGGAAELAGFSANDEWIGIEIATELEASPPTGVRSKAKKTSQAWRLHKLDELPLYLGEHRHCTAIVARDRQLLKLPLTVPAATAPESTTWRLSIAQADKVKAWLG